jgi:TPR repeat protein
MVCLAMCLENGKGAERNPTEAATFYRKAAILGDPLAAKWCGDHQVIFRVNSSVPGQGVLFLNRAGNNFGNAAALKAP